MESLEYTTKNGMPDIVEGIAIDNLMLALEKIVSTFGPNGGYVLDSESARVTKDGASVAQMIKERDKDPFVRMITSSLWRIAADTGDGTTAASYCLMLLLEDEDPPIKEIIENLNSFSNINEWNSHYLLDFVKTVSNNEPEVLEVFSQYGDLPVLARGTVRMETKASLVPGYCYQNSHILFPFKNMVIDSPKTHIGDVFTRDAFEELLNEKYDLIVGQVSTEIAAFVLQGAQQGKPPIVVLPPPAGSYIDDLREFVQIKGVSKVEVSFPDIIFIPQNPEAPIPERELSSLEHQVEYERRKALMSGKFIKVEVGGESNEDVVRKLHVWDDVIKALRAAKKGGVVPGGGQTYKAIHPIFSELHEACKGEKYDTRAIDAWHVVRRSVMTAVELYDTINRISFVV